MAEEFQNSGRQTQISNNNLDVTLYCENKRLETFDGNWRASYCASPNDLASNGFFYIGPKDKVKCIFCLKTLYNWVPGDSVKGEHERHYPKCPFVQKRCQRLNVPGKCVSLHTCTDVFQPSNFDFRLRSYKKWPKQDLIRPKDLAEAGFYYIGIDDTLKCFSCMTSILQWQQGDDPWFEHAKWSPDCVYVLALKGPEFVRLVLDEITHDENSLRGRASNGMLVEENIDPLIEEEDFANGSMEVRPLMHDQVSRDQIDCDMRSVAVMAVMFVSDISVDQMREKIEEIRSSKGSDYTISSKDFEDII